MAVSSTDYTTVVQRCRDAINRGNSLSATDMRLIVDVVEDAANTLDTKATASVAALEALLVTHFAILVADAASPTQAHVNAMVAACATPRQTATAAAAASIVDIATHPLDGRSS